MRQWGSGAATEAKVVAVVAVAVVAVAGAVAVAVAAVRKQTRHGDNPYKYAAYRIHSWTTFQHVSSKFKFHFMDVFGAETWHFDDSMLKWFPDHCLQFWLLYEMPHQWSWPRMCKSMREHYKTGGRCGRLPRGNRSVDISVCFWRQPAALQATLMQQAEIHITVSFRFSYQQTCLKNARRNWVQSSSFRLCLGTLVSSASRVPKSHVWTPANKS